MPLIIISGLPASGKSTRAQQLRQYFERRGKPVHIVSENVAIPRAGFAKNEYFASSIKEKLVRADLKSAALRHLNRLEDVTILDAGNYIKGYRYELYCASKAARTTQCTLFCAIQTERALQLNATRTADDVLVVGESIEDSSGNGKGDDLLQLPNNGQVPYSREIFDALCARFEEPHGNQRWDAPLFTVLPEDELDMEAVYGALFESKPPPANKSTQSAPLSATTYLFELDRQTQAIVGSIVAARKLGSVGDVTVADGQRCRVPDDVTASQLNRLRRQFLNYNKVQLGGGTDLAAVGPLFVEFLNSTFNK